MAVSREPFGDCLQTAGRSTPPHGETSEPLSNNMNRNHMRIFTRRISTADDRRHRQAFSQSIRGHASIKGVSFMELAQESGLGRRRLLHILITGNALIPEVEALAEAIDVSIVTIMGTAELEAALRA